MPKMKSKHSEIEQQTKDKAEQLRLKKEKKEVLSLLSVQYL